ncbi:hypothetical protein BOTNAR_0197g00110 [Botryotinia narcissicola]|uniref:BTB domain-containing protein n=1 Tax=Botryotinia narcissicola TaxID=278944 RepID=A0A4Z1I7R6_9HELO|nr:hypothetical protein BOTNAR_0197g00110 [Botryotinia narcissicola]
MTMPSRKHWPKRPLLDYSEDEFIRIKVGTEPNHKNFNVSTIRLAYYSPYFRTSLNFPREDSQVIELPDICPKIFRHIVQYMNTGTIIIPESDEVIRADPLVFIVDEMVTALNIACGAEGTVVAEDNGVINLLRRWMIWITKIDDWTDYQRERVPVEILNIIAATWENYQNSQEYGIYTRTGSGIGKTCHYYVEDKIDGGDVVKGLPGFPRNRDSGEE